VNGVGYWVMPLVGEKEHMKNINLLTIVYNKNMFELETTNNISKKNFLNEKHEYLAKSGNELLFS
jgi:hypothetical protein